MIFAEDLTKYFDDFLAVNSVDLDVPSGQVLILLGPNGAGKTTTVRMLTSILVPSRGHAQVAGYDVVQQADKVRACVGVLTEHHGLYGRMNSVEYLEFFGKLYSLEPALLRQRIDGLLEQFGLAEARKKRLGEYSKGMRQKLALVRAIIHDPPVLLLDEPTSAMDPESARMVRDAIIGLRSENRTIVLCTHNLVEAEELADQVAIIRRGRIILHGTIESIKRELLGPAEYEVQLASEPGRWTPDLPPGVELTLRKDTTLHFCIDRPQISNPILLRQLLDQKLEVISFQEAPRSLEQAYLEAVSRAAQEEKLA
ncbi:MAG: ABC transporter ATP-binding protein [Anaerolineaceae bacterium]|nr:ABC transporter ATP-binding protein [Anaerolineaceae bacterium]